MHIACISTLSRKRPSIIDTSELLSREFFVIRNWFNALAAAARYEANIIIIARYIEFHCHIVVVVAMLNRAACKIKREGLTRRNIVAKSECFEINSNSDRTGTKADNELEEGTTQSKF
jgi:hypothetical protein